ncbi:outer membrane protein [Ruixingdingia sedimenti]|uniref:Porin family protein n=1 Tax=Ruixingdingia sedimenti TaxID=3073604 RepID=A0ABU1F946_9RHOB|nr:porin family protein [Xinfangfangia sp. LG-4]MDR5653391.1 porin family protein [Xinfangfangia sp. LG-4]
MKTLTGLLISAALAAPAFAGGPVAPVAEPTVAVPLPPAPMLDRNWTGGYVGAQLGYGDIGGDVEGDGAVGGLFGGYTYDFGRWALGGELSYDRANIDIGVGEAKDLARLKLRAGPTFGDWFLYGTVGAAHAKVDVGGTDFKDNGWLVGIGAEYALTDNWSVGGELLHHRFKDFDGTGLDVKPTTLQARVAFRF